MPNATKQDLILDVTQSTGIVKAQVRIVVEQFLDFVGEALAEGHSIEIRGFGTFSNKERKARPARNPKTGETILLESRIVPTFKYSADIKSAVAKASPVLQEKLGISAHATK